MIRKLIAAGIVVVLGLAGTSCASAPQGSTSPEDTTIRVENNNSLLVDVQVLSGGRDYRLGQVETADTDTFDLPRTVSAFDVKVLIDPIGSPEAYVSDQITFAPGDVIYVEVENDLDLTSVRTM
jgi:hypothetical protein